MREKTTTVALVQQPSSVLDTQESLRRAVHHIRDAASRGAQVIVFPESWLSCYPSWVFGAAGWDDPDARKWYGKLLDDSVVVGAAENLDDDLAPLRAAAAETGTVVMMGINERPERSAGSLFNSMVTIGSDGQILNIHRKLTPTHTERIVWANGDASGLKVVDTEFGRLGGLICWEHFHPLARHSLHAQNEQIHVASWPDVPEMHLVASRMYAFEGRCFVLAVGQYLTTEDVPEELVDKFGAGLGAGDHGDGVLFNGGSAVIGPDGHWIQEPVFGEATTLIVTLPLGHIDEFKHDLDLAGHYGRPDVFDLRVDRRRSSTAQFVDEVD